MQVNASGITYGLSSIIAMDTFNLLDNHPKDNRSIRVVKCFWKTVFLSPAEKGGVDENSDSETFPINPKITRALLFRPPKPTQMTITAVHAKPPLPKAPPTQGLLIESGKADPTSLKWT